MTKGKIIFKTPEDVKNFVNTVSKYNQDIDVCKDSITLDGKSIEGLYTLQLNVALTCVIHDDATNCSELIKSIKKFTIKEFE